jgi:hypothetical protein
MCLSRKLLGVVMLVIGVAVGVTFALPPCSDDYFCACSSPIVIDVGGAGIQLTDAVNGVLFDIKGDGMPIQLAWTKPGVRNAFLVLDRDGNGKVDSGKELFGNYTAQPDCQNPNGFLALAELDKPENGGNGDGVINKSDGIYDALRLWIDSNHNGISEPEELFPLPDLGVVSLSLDYKESARRDRYGNRFRYRARVNVDIPTQQSTIGPFAWDVFLTTRPPAPEPVQASPVGMIDGGKTPEKIPTEVAHEIFLRIASCSDSDPELYRQKCKLVHRAPGLSDEDAKLIPGHLLGVHDQLVAMDEEIHGLRHVTATNSQSRLDALLDQRRSLIKAKVTSLRQKFSVEGQRKFDAYIESMKAKIRFVPDVAPKG